MSLTDLAAQQDGFWIDYTPVLGSTGVAPNLGNGSIKGKYARLGKVCIVTVVMTWGSTSTAGSGAWTFSLPFPSKGNDVGVARVLDAGTAHYVLAMQVSGDVMLGFVNASGSNLDGSAPMVWAAGDFIAATIMYQVDE